MAKGSNRSEEAAESSNLGKYDRMWLVQLENLKRFRELYGRWPNPTERFPGRTQIGQWLYRTRQAYFEGRLVEFRLAHLRKIRCPLNPIRHVDGAWMEQFERLKRFRARHTDRWPYTAEEFPEGNKLGRWFHEQRLRNTRGTLKRPWADLLRSIGFPFRRKVTKRKDLWLVRYGELKEFRKRNSNRWPAKSDHPSRENMLGAWCHAQRTKRKKRVLSRERIRLLDALAFEWRPIDSLWMRHYESVLEFRRRHPEKRPDAGSANPEERALAAWLAFQKQRIRLGGIQPGRKRLLLRFKWG